MGIIIIIIIIADLYFFLSLVNLLQWAGITL